MAADRGALGPALAVVALGGVSRGLGAFGEEGLLGLLGGLSIGLVAWLLAAAAVWWMGVEWLGHASDFPSLLRALGFAAVPLIALAPCALLPAPGRSLAAAALHAWATLAFVAAVRAALGATLLRALWICAAALAIGMLLLVLAAGFLFDPIFLD